MNDQAQRLRELARSRELKIDIGSCIPAGKSVCKSLAVTSGKGGVGKTNIALFISVSLASSGKKVLLLDADLGLANVHILLGIAPKKNVSHFLDAECGIEQVIIQGPSGIDILPGASGLEKLANLDFGRIELLQREFMKLENKYDYVIIDTGAGIGNTVTQFAAQCDTSLLVMTPEPTSLADAYAMVKVLYEKKCQKIGVIVNRTLSDREGNETFDRLNTIVVKFLKRPVELFGIIPENREVSQCVKRQRIIVLEKGFEQFNGRIHAISRKISGAQVIRSHGFFTKMWSRVSSKGLIE